MINIAIIDDGINEKFFPNIGILKNNIEILPEGNIQQRENYNPWEISHGTICASIIAKYFPYVNLSSVKILDYEKKNGRINQLIIALKWCLDNEIDIVNLSLGSSYYADFYELLETVRLLVKKKIIIVAAANNSNIITYPASFGDVIGVKTCKFGLLQQQYYIYRSNTEDGIEIIASSQHILRDYRKNLYMSISSNSFAAPMITAKVAELLSKYGKLGIDEIKWHLWNESKSNLNSYQPNYYYNIEWAENVILFIINQGKALYNSFKHTIFNIQQIINYKCKDIIQICKYITEYFEKHNNIIKNIDSVFIYLDEGFIYENDDLNELYRMLSVLKKNIVLLLNKTEVFRGNCSKDPCCFKFSYTKSWDLDISNILHKPIPIVVAFSYTEKMQLDLLYQLSECFRDDGFNCLVTTDSCLGILYGFHYLAWKDTNSSIENIKKMISFYNADILIIIIMDAKKFSEIDKALDSDLKIYISDKNHSLPHKLMKDNIYLEIIDKSIVNCYYKSKTKNIRIANPDISFLYKLIRDIFC